MNDAHIAYAEIGKFCSMAAMTRLNPDNRPTWWASQAHFTYRASAYFPGEADDEDFFAWRRAQKLTRGHDVWIGHGVVVLAGRRVGTGAVVAKDVPPCAIVAGVPGELVKWRSPPEIAEGAPAPVLVGLEPRGLRKALPDIRALPIAAFLEKYGA